MSVKEWKVIEKATNYEVSNFGEVRNKKTKKILRPSVVNGYLSIGLRINNKTVTSFIHRLVATSFLLCSNKIYIVNHKDGNRINNNIENLEWVSLSENSKHAFRLGLSVGHKLKVSQYTLNGVFIESYDSLVDAEKKTGIYNGHISSVCRGKKGKKTAGGYIWKYTDYIQPIIQCEPPGKILTDFPNYKITNEGRIYNIHRNKYLIPAKNKGGYMTLSLSNGKKRRNFLVHRLVASLYLDNPHNYLAVNHKDCDKTNNIVDNLEWISNSDNMKHIILKKKTEILQNNF